MTGELAALREAPSDLGTITVVVSAEGMPSEEGLLSHGAGLTDALLSHGFTVVAQAGSADDVVLQTIRHRPDLCVIDAALKGDSLAAVKQISRESPQTRIAVLAESLEGDDLLDSVRAGADGYMLWSTAPTSLITALRALLRGEPAIPRRLTDALITEVRQEPAEVHPIDARSIPRAAKRSFVRFVPRFVRHFRRRRRSGMSRPDAWLSTRLRMREYV